MSALWTLEFNIFVMMAVGFIIRKVEVVGKESEGMITDLVLDVVLPCNIFTSFIGDYSGVSTWDFVVILLISIGIQLLAMVYARLCFPRHNPDRRCNLGYAMICSNAGFLGSAITEGFFGIPGLMLTSIYLIPQRIMMWTEGIAMYSGSVDTKAMVKKVVTHPCIIACVLGLLVMVLRLSVPKIILTPIQTIGRCNTAITMMMVGMILAEIDLRKLVDKNRCGFHHTQACAYAFGGIHYLLTAAAFKGGDRCEHSPGGNACRSDNQYALNEV